MIETKPTASELLQRGLQFMRRFGNTRSPRWTCPPAVQVELDRALAAIRSGDLASACAALDRAEAASSAPEGV